MQTGPAKGHEIPINTAETQGSLVQIAGFYWWEERFSDEFFPERITEIFP